REGRPAGGLGPGRWNAAGDLDSIVSLAQWREAANPFFPAQFPVTLDGTRRWLVKDLLEVPDRLLFWVRDPGGHRVGHVGLFRFDFDRRGVEVDNVVRGLPGSPGIMSAGVQALVGWTFGGLGMAAVFLRVLSA